MLKQRVRAAAIAAAFGTFLGACGGGASAGATSLAARVADSIRADSAARARQDSINRAQPGYIVDSVFPIAEEIRRFKAAIGGTPVTSLRGGAASRDALVERIVAAVVARDSVGLARMAVTPREFADLVYPSSPFSRPPSMDAPGRVWMTIANPSRSGRIRLLRRLGGTALRYVGHSCDAEPERQGKNLLWTHCTVTLQAADGSRHTARLFGTIIERDGQFKVMSFTNEF
jgi:hypothetical protein